MLKKTRKKLIAFGLSVGITALLILWILWGNTALELNTYRVTGENLPKAFDGFRIAQVSDLHNAEMGEDNEDLLAMLQEAAPDIVVITGDLIDSNNTDMDVALAFAENALKIAPCYYVTGNHEAWAGEYDNLKKGLTDLGVTVLENEKTELLRDGERITLVGVNDPSFGDETMSATLEQLIGNKDGYTVLLSHRPELFDTYVESSADLVFSGHAHGGQFRIPFVGGAVAPNQGLFPEYDEGIYTEGGTHMVVSRGIGNSIIPFRVNNRPEVVLIELSA